jgi:hypothetical protein
MWSAGCGLLRIMRSKTGPVHHGSVHAATLIAFNYLKFRLSMLGRDELQEMSKRTLSGQTSGKRHLRKSLTAEPNIKVLLSKDKGGNVLPLDNQVPLIEKGIITYISQFCKGRRLD